MGNVLHPLDDSGHTHAQPLPHYAKSSSHDYLRMNALERLRAFQSENQLKVTTIEDVPVIDVKYGCDDSKSKHNPRVKAEPESSPIKVEDQDSISQHDKTAHIQVVDLYEGYKICPNSKERSAQVKGNIKKQASINVKRPARVPRVKKRPKLVPEFILFSKLPSLVRAMIWKMTMRPRLLAFKTSSDGVLYCSSDTFKPPVLYTCRESRNEALRFYRIFHPIDTPLSCRVYFHPQIDTIFCQFRYDNYTGMNAPHVSDLECHALESAISAGARYLAIPWGLWVDMRVRAKYITLYNHIRSSKLLEEVTLVELRRPKLAGSYRIIEVKETDGLTNEYGFNSWSARAEEEAKKNPKWTVPKFRYVRVKYQDRMGEGWNNKSSLLQPLEVFPSSNGQKPASKVETKIEVKIEKVDHK